MSPVAQYVLLVPTACLLVVDAVSVTVDTMASYYLQKMSIFRSSKTAASADDTTLPSPGVLVPPPPKEPDVEDLGSAERGALASLIEATAPALDRATASHPTDDMLRCVATSTLYRDTLLLCYLRDALGSISTAATALSATLAWRAKHHVTRIPATAVDAPDATFPGYILGPACDDLSPGGGGVLVYTACAQFDRRTVRRAAFVDGVIATLEAMLYRDPPAAAPSTAAVPAGRRDHPAHCGRYARRFTAIMDFTGWSAMRNVDLPTVKGALTLFFAHYPERHGRVYLVNYPVSVYAVYRMIAPLLSERVIRQIRWVPTTGEGAVPVLRREVGASRLPRWLGGDAEEPVPVGVDRATLAAFQVRPLGAAGAPVGAPVG